MEANGIIYVMDYSEWTMTTVGVVGSFLAAESFRQTSSSIYAPMLDFAKQYVNGTRFDIIRFDVALLGEVKKEMKFTSDHVSAVMTTAIQILNISEQVGVSCAFWVGGIETGVNFFRSLHGNRPVVVDILEGGIRGSLLGLFITLLHREPEYRGIQIATGVATGYVIGMMGAFLGSAGGHLTHAIHSSISATQDPLNS